MKSGDGKAARGETRQDWEVQSTRDKQKVGIEMATLCVGLLGPVCYGYQIEALECGQHNGDSVKNAGQKAHGCHNRGQDMTEFNFAQ